MTSRALHLDEILAAARQLPRKSQAALAETLLRDAAAGDGLLPEQPGLLPLPGMSETELCAEVVAALRARNASWAERHLAVVAAAMRGPGSLAK